LLDVIAVGESIVAEDVTVVPELGDKLLRVAHEANDQFIAEDGEERPAPAEFN
jgi:hypothetical protein